MKITKVEFNRFKVYESYKEFTFDDGIILIIAENGRGKSTIVDNVRLCLLNKTDAKNLEELINYNSSEKSFEIATEFEIDCDSYRSELSVEKVGKSTNSNRKVYKNNELIVEGSNPCIEYLSEILDPVLVDNALFMKQGRNQIVDITDSERREVIKKLKDIDYTDMIKSDIEPEIERLKQEIIDIDKEIFSLENKKYNPRIIKDVPFSETMFNNYVEERDKLQAELTLIQDKLKEKENKELDLKILLSNIEKNSNNISSNNNKKENLNIELLGLNDKKLEEKESTIKKISELETTLSTLSPDYETKKLELDNTFNTTITSIETNIDNLTKSLVDYPTRRISKFNTTELDKLIEDRTNIKSIINSLSSSISNMKNGNCPTCNKPYELITISDYEKNLKIQENNLSDLNIEINKLQTEKLEHEKLVETNNNNTNKKLSINNDIDKLKTKKINLEQQLSKDIDNLKSTLDNNIKNTTESLVLYKDKLSNIDTVYEAKTSKINNDIEHLNKSNTDLELTNIELDSKKIKLQKDIESYKLESILDKETTLNNLNIKIKDYNDVLIENQTIKKYNLDLDNEQKQDKEKLDSTLKTKDNLKNTLLEYTNSKNILSKDLPNFIINNSIEDLEDGMNEIIDKVYYKSLNVSFEQNKASIELKYGENKDNLKTCRGGLSGAESGLVNLSFISSFNKALGLDCMFLDEVDSAMTDETAENLYSSVCEMSRDFSQLFLISHKVKMQSFIENNFEAQVVEI